MNRAARARRLTRASGRVVRPNTPAAAELEAADDAYWDQPEGHRGVLANQAKAHDLHRGRPPGRVEAWYLRPLDDPRRQSKPSISEMRWRAGGVSVIVNTCPV